ncbi:MAG: hypothetical protein M3441_12780 [Chloroflexota bacterium]|nr:hypothetical protein [Chloroflexota bacterium]
MGTATTVLLDALVNQQRTLQLSDRAFANKLGISKALWIMTRQGDVPVGISLLAGVVREFGDLRDEVLDALAEHRAGYHNKKDTAAVSS